MLSRLEELSYCVEKIGMMEFMVFESNKRASNIPKK